MHPDLDRGLRLGVQMRSLAKWVPVVLPQRLALEEAARG